MSNYQWPNTPLPDELSSCTLEEVVNAVLRVKHMQSVQAMIDRLGAEGFEVIRHKAKPPAKPK